MGADLMAHAINFNSISGPQYYPTITATAANNIVTSTMATSTYIHPDDAGNTSYYVYPPLEYVEPEDLPLWEQI
jgi:hypothetical protein